MRAYLHTYIDPLLILFLDVWLFDRLRVLSAFGQFTRISGPVGKSLPSAPGHDTRSRSGGQANAVWPRLYDLHSAARCSCQPSQGSSEQKGWSTEEPGFDTVFGARTASFVGMAGRNSKLSSTAACLSRISSCGRVGIHVNLLDNRF